MNFPLVEFFVLLPVAAVVIGVAWYWQKRDIAGMTERRDRARRDADIDRPADTR